MAEVKNKIPRCYIYTRVSTELQVDGYSLDAQKDRLLKYAEYQKMQVVKEYCDAGKSGKSVTGRPEFSQMLKDVTEQKDNIDYILVFKLSRFGRNAADVLNSLQLIQDYGVNLICVEDGIDSSKESGKLTITVLSAVAEIERENILVQTMEGRRQKAREGKWNGGTAPYGYRLDKANGSLVPDPDEAEIVKIIFDKFAHTTMGACRIANYLNDHGYRKNKSREFEVSYFNQSMIMSVLDNPTYIGKIVYGRTKKTKVKGTRDEYQRLQSKDFLMAEGKHEAIIDLETWNIVRAKRAETGFIMKKSYSEGHEHLLTSLIKCPGCGGRLNGFVGRHNKKKVNAQSKDVFYYRCFRPKSLPDGEGCSFRHAIRQEALNAEVEEIMFAMVNNEEFSQFVHKKLEEKIDVSVFEKERGNLIEQLASAEKAKSKIVEQMDNLQSTDKLYNRKYADFQKRFDAVYSRIEGLEASIAEVNKKIEAKYGDKISIEAMWGLLADFEALYPKMTELEKKEFYRSFIENIELYPEKRPDGGYLKRIDFKFPIVFKAENGQKSLLSTNGLETVVLLTHA